MFLLVAAVICQREMSDLPPVLGKGEAGTNVLVTVETGVDSRELFLDAVAGAESETSPLILLATAESGRALFDDCREKLHATDDQPLEVIDGSVKIPSDQLGEETNNIRYVPPVSEYLAQLGDEFGNALEDLEADIDDSAAILENRVGFYSLGPLLDYAGDTELVFRFICILVNQIENAGGSGLFVVDADYDDAIARLEVLFDTVVSVDAVDGERSFKVASAI